MATVRISLRREEKLLVGYIAVAHSLIHVLELTYAAVLPFLLLEFKEGLFVMGVAATFFAFAFGLGALPAGMLADRIGSRRLLEICLVGGAIASVGLALSPSIYSLTVFLSLLGLLLGLYHPPAMALISRGVREKALGRGLAVHGIGGSLGIASAPILAAGIAALFSWRVAYLVPGALSLLAAIILHRSPAAHLAPEAGQGSLQGAPAANPDKKLLLLPLVVVFATYLFNGFIYRGMVTFLPLHLKESVQLSIAGIDAAALAGAFATLALLAGIAGQWLGGTWGDRFRRERVLLPSTIVLTAALLLMGKVGGLWLVLAGAVMAISHFMSQPVSTGLIADYSPARLQGRMYGIAFFCTFGLGSFAAAFAGWVAERSGTSAVFLSLAAFGGAVILAAFYLLWMARRRWQHSPSP